MTQQALDRYCHTMKSIVSHCARHPLAAMSDLSQVPRLRNWRHQRGRRNAVFVHIPKTAGKTVSYELDVCKLVSMSAVRFRSPWCGRLTFGHIHYPTLCRAGHVPTSFSASAFKFAFVRNSWDRMVSLFHYLKSRCLALHPATSFQSFLYLVRDQAYDSPGLFNASGISQAASQLAWLRDGDREFIDFIGRYETLAADLSVVAGELGCPDAALRVHINRSPRGHYREYYDAELRALVAKVYEDEIDRFGFQF